MPPSYERLVSASGSFLALRSQATSPIRTLLPTRQPGAPHWPTSPTPSATSLPTSATRASSRISTCVASSLASRSSTPTNLTARAPARTSWRTIPQPSAMHTGNSGASESTKQPHRMGSQPFIFFLPPPSSFRWLIYDPSSFTLLPINDNIDGKIYLLWPEEKAV
jgi:hypothetical protein